MSCGADYLCHCGFLRLSTDGHICKEDSDCKTKCRVNVKLVVLLSIGILVAVALIIFGIIEEHRVEHRGDIIRSLLAKNLGASASEKLTLGV
jgi:hypothetical protein